jgi:hypothetical protein
LGSLLFLAFINDVADNMTGFGRLFADDTCIDHMAHNEENLHTLISTDKHLGVIFSNDCKWTKQDDYNLFVHNYPKLLRHIPK